MEEKIHELQRQIAEIQEQIFETQTLLDLTQSEHQKAHDADQKKIQHLKTIAQEKLEALPAEDEKRAIILEKIRLFETSCEKKSQEFLSEIESLSKKRETLASASSQLTKEMIQLYSAEDVEE